MTSSGCCSHLDNPAPHITLSHTEISQISLPHNLQVAGGSLGHKWTPLSVLHILICKAFHTFQLKTGHQRRMLSQMEIGVTRRRRRRRRRRKKNAVIGQAYQQSSSKPSSFLSIYVAHIFQSCNKVVANFSFSYVHSFSNFLKFIDCPTFHPPKGCNFTRASFNKIQKLTGRMVCLYIPARSNKCILSCVISVYIWAWSSSLRRRAVDRCQRAKAEYVVSVFHI